MDPPLTWTDAAGFPGVGLGLAYNAYVPNLLRDYPDAVDYVEVPFELLCHDSAVLNISSQKPIVLHCASLSIAGSVPPPPATLDAVEEWVRRTGTPWLGEHLSFILADPEEAGGFADEYAPGEPYNIGYTVSPPMNEASVEQVVKAVERIVDRLRVPLLLENPPIYFRAPGTTMTQVEFISEICQRCPVSLLLDLAHFYITSCTFDFDPFKEILSLPLGRVVEAHVSGVELQSGTHWDNHASRAPDVVLEMLEVTQAAGGLRAVTLEYNWSSRFPRKILIEELARVRRALFFRHGRS